MNYLSTSSNVWIFLSFFFLISSVWNFLIFNLLSKVFFSLTILSKISLPLLFLQYPCFILWSLYEVMIFIIGLDFPWTNLNVSSFRARVFSLSFTTRTRPGKQEKLNKKVFNTWHRTGLPEWHWSIRQTRDQAKTALLLQKMQER